MYDFLNSVKKIIFKKGIFKKGIFKKGPDFLLGILDFFCYAEHLAEICRTIENREDMKGNEGNEEARLAE